jgi:hypothetical protein
MRSKLEFILGYIVNTIVDKAVLWPFYYPIIFLMKEVRADRVVQSNGITILALNVNRFRGDLEVLAQSGFKVYKMPYKWQTRIFHAYKDRNLRGQFNAPSANSSIYIDRERVRKYLSRLLKEIFLKKDIDCIISAGLFYNQDLDWGAVSVKLGYPYIVFHRENLIVNKDLYVDFVKWAKYLNKIEFVGTSIVFHNKIIKGIYDKYSGVNSDRIHALGSLRMDKYISDTKSKKNRNNNKRIVLFHFASFNAIFTNRKENFGWHKLHDKVHTSFVELSVENPGIEFVIKHKGVGWKETEKLLNDLDAFNISNLKIYGDSSCNNAQKLILESDVVTGFCSTALLEAAIAGKAIVYPLFDEANDERYSDFLCFSDSLNMFDVATSKDEYKELIVKRMKYSVVSKKVMRLRKLQFEKNVSSLNSDALQKYSELIISEVKDSNPEKITDKTIKNML